jgi:hypothetical protein
MQPANTPPSRWHRYRRQIGWAWLTIIGLFLLILGAGGLQQWLTQKSLTARLAAIRAQGLPTTLAELDAFYTHLPAADNGTPLLLQFRNLHVEWDDINAPYFGVMSSNSVLYVTNPITPAARAALQDIVVSNRTALQSIYAAVAKPGWRSPVDLNHGATNLFPDLTEPKMITLLLRLESLHHFAEGRHSDALKSISTSFQVSDSLAGEPILISYLVRNACLDISKTSLEKLLQRAEFPAGDLAQLQQVIAVSEAKTDLLRVLHGERAFIIGSWQEPASQQLFAPATPFDEWPEPLQKLGWAFYENGGAKTADLLNFLSLCEELEAIIKLNPVEALPQLEKLETRFLAPGKPSLEKIATTSLASTLLLMPGQHASLIARLRVAQTALAIERFRLANQRLPKTLGELTPQYLQTTPLDPFTQAPLLYRITEKGFRIYSTGKNAQDDGGLTRAEKAPPDNDDIVFTVERMTSP